MIRCMSSGPWRLRASILAFCLALAGCGSGGSLAPVPSGPASSAQPAANDPVDEVCEADPLGCVVVAEGEPLLIGTALTLTGPNAALGLDSQYGAQVALNLRGEVLGHDVELVHHDDRCSSDGGTAAASLLVEMEALVGVIGTSCSSAAGQAADILGARGILLVSPSNTAPRLTQNVPEQAFYARTAGNDLLQARAVAQFVCAELTVTTVATVHDGTAYARALEEAFASEIGDRCDAALTERAELDPDGSSVDGVLAGIAESNDGASPDLVFIPIASDAAVQLARRAGTTEGMADTLLAGLQVGEDGMMLPDLVDGMYLSAPTRTPTGDFYEDAFLTEYRNVSSEDDPIGAYHGHAYDAVNMLLDAAVEVVLTDERGLHFPRSALQAVLFGTPGYEGITGTFTCNPSGDCGTPGITVSLVEGGNLQPVWP